MARSRNIKPSFFDNEDLAEIDFAARLLFIGLWTLADREGRLEYRPKKIKAQLFPYDSVDVPLLHRYLTDLARLGLVSFYRHEQQTFLWVVKFSAHQSPHKTERESGLPSPLPENLLSVQEVELMPVPITVTAPCDNRESMVDIGFLKEESRIGILNPDTPGALPRRPGGQTPQFEEFWKLCPRTNCSKQEAAQAYHRAITRGADHDDIIRGLNAYRQFLAASGSPAAHATTWLNNHRWTVDYDAALRQRGGQRPANGDWDSEGKRLAAKYLAAQPAGQSDS